jgi:hypothetical protein
MKTTFKNSFYTLTALAALTLLSACQTTQSTPQINTGCKTWDSQVGSPQLMSVSMLSPELAKFVGVSDLITSRTGTGLASVQVDVHNCSDVDVVLILRTRFSGTRGQSESPSAWKTVFLSPRGQATYAESAISAMTERLAVDIYDANRGQSQFAPNQNYVVPSQTQTK